MMIVGKKGILAGAVALALLLGLAHGSGASHKEEGAFAARFTAAAIERTRHRVRYDGSYVVIGYPNGDVPDDTGVCTDVVIRSYRAVGIDLQQLVHEDMQAHFSAYPALWGMTRPDPNIDHRRVPNLQTFFTRHGQSLPVTRNPDDYRPGDLVTWMVGGKLPHIGIVADHPARPGGEPPIVHNIGQGVELDDHMLFYYPITGHYRYGGPG